jgi:hypothetical protein
MGQYRLESLILIFIEQELACKLDFNEIIDEFKNVIYFKRRLSLLEIAYLYAVMQYLLQRIK